MRSGKTQTEDRSESGSPRSAKGGRARVAILEAAGKLFAERGFLGVTLDEIAERSGAKRSLILYHFGSKIALWREASAIAAQAFNHAVRAKLEARNSEGTEPREHTISAWLDAFVENPAYPKMLVFEGSATGPRLDWLIQHFDYASEIPGTPKLRHQMAETVLRDALMAIFIAMSALGPLMEASMAKVTGRSTVGIYPMSRERRDELVAILLKIVQTFDS